MTRYSRRGDFWQGQLVNLRSCLSVVLAFCQVKLFWCVIGSIRGTWHWWRIVTEKRIYCLARAWGRASNCAIACTSCPYFNVLYDQWIDCSEPRGPWAAQSFASISRRTFYMRDRGWAQRKGLSSTRRVAFLFKDRLLKQLSPPVFVKHSHERACK